jgi:hypothetical protein
VLTGLCGGGDMMAGLGGQGRVAVIEVVYGLCRRRSRAGWFGEQPGEVRRTHRAWCDSHAGAPADSVATSRVLIRVRIS